MVAPVVTSLIPYVFFYLRQLQVAEDPCADVNPDSFAIISSTIDISIIFHTNSSSPRNTHSERSSSNWRFTVGNENNQVGILFIQFICSNIITQRTVNMEYTRVCYWRLRAVARSENPGGGL